MKENGTKEITVRLTTDRSVLSWFTFFLGFGAHTHAAIGLRDEDGYFYSFNTKGFKKEYLNPRKPRKINQTIYRISVSEESYQALSDKLNGMYEEREQYAYSMVGVIMCLFRIPFWMRYKKRWFCSQFVAKSLTETGCLKVRGIPEYTFPGHIAKAIKKSDQLISVEHKNELEPIPVFIMRLPMPVFRKVGKTALWCKLQAFKYMRKLKKMCVYIWYEQYKELLRYNEELTKK